MKSSFAALCDPGFICDALETDWLAGAGGFEPLHLEIRSAELHRANGALSRRSASETLF